MSKFKILGCLSLLLVLPALGLAQKQSKSMVPVLNSISPTSATAGDGSFTLTATGSNFTSGSVVRWNGSAVSTTVVSSTQLQASVVGTLIASASTAQITVFTSGRFGGTSNGLTFTINAPAPPPPPPPPPSPDPLTITTTSVPSSTAGSSYNASLAASGGTPAYGWGTVSDGGSLPPGLTLAANGTLSGTPSTAGTYSFTAKAHDSASTPQAVQKQFSLTVAAPPPPPGGSGILFQTGFEPADPTVDAGMGGDTVITSPPPGGRTGNALQIHYHICGATDGSCGSSSQDFNRYVTKVVTPGVNDVFMKADVYFQSTPTGATAGTEGEQRKLMWVGDSTTASNNVGNNYQIILGSWTASGGQPTNTINISALNQSTGGSPCAFSGFQIYNLYQGMNWNTWYTLEWEVKLNTPGQSDGVLNLWVNGTQTANLTGLNLRGGCSGPLTFFSLGEQTNRYAYDVIEEYRYWDNWIVSTTFVP